MKENPPKLNAKAQVNLSAKPTSNFIILFSNMTPEMGLPIKIVLHIKYQTKFDTFHLSNKNMHKQLQLYQGLYI